MKNSLQRSKDKIMDGILVIRKEKGYTSHDVVAKLRGILHMKKIGHTGTLDPAAEEYFLLHWARDPAGGASYRKRKNI